MADDKPAPSPRTVEVDAHEVLGQASAPAIRAAPGRWVYPNGLVVTENNVARDLALPVIQ